MSMTVEELRENLACIICGEKLCDKKPLNVGENSVTACVEELAKAEESIQTFAQWCKENNIVQVVEGELPAIHEVQSAAEKIVVADLLKWHKQSLKPVSEVLR